MSSFIVSNESIDAIVEGARRARLGVIDREIHPVTPEECKALKMARIDPHLKLCARNREELGRFLAAYNVVMANAGYSAEPFAYVAYEAGSGREFTDGEVLGACTCYEYQVDNADSYRRSGVRSFLEWTRDGCVMRAFQRLGEPVPYGIGGHDISARYRR